MDNLAVRAVKLSKRYRIGRKIKRNRTLQDLLADAAYAPFRAISSAMGPRPRTQPGNGGDNTIWALKGVSFDVRQGEVIGVIGRNGAGKTTLLKILSRITEPTEGYAAIRGRVGALLEVGTGFHMELTGRDNVYLSGAILGMRRAEIRRQFDEIVDFAEVERFIDTPVKYYSSGMRVRLAFAVAAHLEPEVLLVDEVLAVGDVAFQKKCLGKMGDVVGEGRTVLFVSHNMGAVKSLCQRGLYLDGGRLEYSGPMDVCIRNYLKSGVNRSVPFLRLPVVEALPVQLVSLAVFDEAGQLSLELPHDRSFQLQVQVLVSSRISNVYIAIHIHEQDLTTLLLSRDFEADENRLGPREPGLYTYHLRVPASLLVPGEYSISAYVAQSTPGRLVGLSTAGRTIHRAEVSTPGRLIHRVDHVCNFEVVDNGSIQARMGFPWVGKLAVPLYWEEVEVVSKEKLDAQY